MRQARVVWGGAIHAATTAAEGSLRLEDGRLVTEDEVEWLPPVEAQTVFAVGLNYAEHARELAFEARREPRPELLVFLKGPNTLAGHRGRTVRPEGVSFMHYECELAVVIGRPARRVARAHALDYVAGYCVANDYVVRDYLENWYRPNLRAKNRDAATLLGPWLVDAGDVPDPMNLELRTWVNGEVTQRGNTRDMIVDVPGLIEYLSAFMTLGPDDIILTGTPQGVVDVKVGDEVITEIDGVGRLAGYIVAEPRVLSAETD